MKLELDIDDIDLANLAYVALCKKRRDICGQIGSLCKIQTTYYPEDQHQEAYVQQAMQRISKLHLELRKINLNIVNILKEYEMNNEQLESVM